MRKSLVRSSLLCGSLVMLSGCYSNGKFHSPTWSDMAWWKKDKVQETSLAAAPSVSRPSDEAVADKNSPGAKGGSAPPYASAASFNTPPAADSRYPDTGYPNTGYPESSYGGAGAGGAGAGGTNWAANGNGAAASVAANPYTKPAGGYDTGSRYDAGAANVNSGRTASHAQNSPYDSNYPGAASAYSSPNGGYESRPNYSAPASTEGTGRGAYSQPTGSYENPHYRANESTAPAGGSRYGDSGYVSPDRYAPPATTGSPNDKYTAPNYASDQDAARRFDGPGYREMTGDRFASDPRTTSTNQAPPAGAYDPRTADSRNVEGRSDANTYNPGKTGYQPAGVPDYSAPGVDGRSSSAAASYQPGGTSRYEGNTSGNASTAASTNRSGASAYGENPYVSEPRPDNRYQEPPVNSREGAARY
jgi:hypothetical protein